MSKVWLFKLIAIFEINLSPNCLFYKVVKVFKRIKKNFFLTKMHFLAQSTVHPRGFGKQIPRPLKGGEMGSLSPSPKGMGPKRYSYIKEVKNWCVPIFYATQEQTKKVKNLFYSTYFSCFRSFVLKYLSWTILSNNAFGSSRFVTIRLSKILK